MMTNKAKLGEDIVTQLVAIQGLSHQALSAGDDFQLPRWVSAGNGDTIQITKAIDDLISQLARELRLSRPAVKSTAKEGEWRSWVRSLTGPVLAGLDLSRPFAEIGSELVAAVEIALDEQLAGLPSREHAFGVTLFRDPGIPAFAIGPVTFESADDWLTRKTADGGIHPVTARRIRKAWGGNRVAPRKPGISAFQERNILRAIAGAPYVATVSIGSFAAEAGLEAAASAARLALITVALLWPGPSQALEGMRLRFDARHRLEEAITFIPGRTVVGGSKLRGRPFGPLVNLADWLTTLASAAPVFAVAGEAIALLTDPRQSSPRQNLIRALLQALLWFYAGCREESDAIAIVNFNASLDALAGGTHANGILEVLEARFGVKRTDPIYLGGPSFKSTVEDLYNHGRSRLVHGTSDWIGHDLTARRSRAEELAGLALLRCLEFSGTTPGVTSACQLKK